MKQNKLFPVEYIFLALDILKTRNNQDDSIRTNNSFSIFRKCVHCSIWFSFRMERLTCDLKKLSPLMHFLGILREQQNKFLLIIAFDRRSILGYWWINISISFERTYKFKLNFVRYIHNKFWSVTLSFSSYTNKNQVLLKLWICSIF